MTIEEWTSRFADEFFDLFVKYQLENMKERIMPEYELFDLSYTQAEEHLDMFVDFDPEEAAQKVFESLKK